MRALSEGKLVAYQGAGTGRPIFELTIKGRLHRIAITVGEFLCGPSVYFNARVEG